MAVGVVWGVLTAVGAGLLAVWAGFEARGVWSRRRGDTYSEWMRPWARRHPVVFGLLCGVVVGVGTWLPGHILG